MNNGLGINFFRYLKEEDGQTWVQVFAKLPFDNVDLGQKGALFGVVKLKKTDDWSELDMEMTSWIEEYYNGVENTFDIADFYSKFKVKYQLIDNVWLWIVSDQEKRTIRVMGGGSVSFLIKRSVNKIDLSKNVDSMRVLSGELKSGDEILFGIGGLFLEEDGVFENINLNNSYGYFKIQVFDLPEEKVVKAEEKQVLELTTKKEIPSSNEDTEIATDKYIGKLTFFSRVKNLFLHRTRGLVIADEDLKRKRKKVSLLLGLLFVGLLVISLTLGGLKKRSEMAESRWTEFSEPIEKMVTDAVDIVKINPSGAKRMVEEAKQRFSAGKSVFDNDKTSYLEKKIEETWVLVSGEKIADLKEAVNLELVRAGVNANRISYSEDNLFSVTSGESGIVMSVVVDSKEMKVLAGKGAGLGWIDSVINKKKAYVLTKGGVFVAGNESSSLVFDTAVTDPISLAVFGSNLYVLEKGNKEVFKYSVTDSGFGERQRWLKEGQFISNAPLDMDIDVDIWILEQGNVLERFRRGVKETFVLSGLPKEIEVEKVSVEVDGNRIALLSSKQATIVFCSKETGVCDKQLKGNNLGEVKDIAFGSQGVLYVLLKSSIGVVN